MLFNLEDRILKWRYAPTNIKVLLSNETIEIPNERLLGLYIENNYDEYYFPLLKVTFNLDTEIYYKILENKNNCYFYLRIDKYYLEGENNPTKSLRRKFIDQRFQLIMDEDTSDMYKSLKEDENKGDYTNKTASHEGELGDGNNNRVEFYLFLSSINNLKKLVNKVLYKATISDAISYLCTEAGINNLLMSCPQNYTIYEHLLIPPMSILKAYSFLDTYYGIFCSGSIIWFDYNNSYIVPYSGRCEAFNSNEIKVTNIIVPKSTNMTHEIGFGNLKKIDDISNNYIVADGNSINIENQSISDNIIFGNDIQVVDSYDEESVSSNSTAKSKDNNLKKIFENNTENKFLPEIYSVMTTSKSDIITLRLQNFDLDCITPNKRFNVIFEDSNYIRKYNGNYIVAGITNEFLLDGEDLSINSVIILRKM